MQKILKMFGFSEKAKRGSTIGLTELTSLEKEFLPPLLEIQETPPSPVKRQVLISIVAFVFAMIAWAYVGKIDVVSTSQGKFVPDGKVKAVQSMETATVRAIYVKEGQQVKKGDLLLELDSTISTADLSSNVEKLALSELSQERLLSELNDSKPVYQAANQSAEMVAMQENLRQARRAAYAAKLTQAEQALKEKAAQLESGLAILKKLQETGAIIKEKEESARDLAKSGAISRIDYLQLKQDLIGNQSETAAQLKNVEQLRHARDEAEQKIIEVRQENKSGILSDLDNHANTLAERRGSVTKSRRMVEQQRIVSPVDGTVQSVNVGTVGGVVTPQAPLVVIVPKDTPLIVEATLSNDEIGFIKIGQRVDIKLDGFPFQKFGTLGGTLVWISPDAEETSIASNTAETGEVKSGQGGNGREKISYKIHVKPDSLTMKAEGRVIPIIPGMTLEADIITERRRVIDFFLSPVSKYLSEGMKVR